MIEYKNIVFSSPDVPNEMEGYRIVFISDTHSLSIKNMNSIVNKLNNQHIDLLLLGGDMTSYGTAPLQSIEVLSKIKTVDGIYGIEGNHDNYTALFSAMEKYSINPLSNNGLYIRDRFFLAGVEDLWKRNPNITQAIEKSMPDDFILLIAHNPDTTMQQDTSNVNIILSGHTHGGQITFFGIWAPYLSTNRITRYGQRFRSGWSTSKDGIPVYVSNGAGDYLPRVFARPQVIILTLHQKGR